LQARRWWNARTAPAASRPTSGPAGVERRSFTRSEKENYALLFFAKEHDSLLKKTAQPLNRLDARRDWTVIALSPDDPNEIAPLVYRNRLRFAVGAGSPDQRTFGARRLPCLVILRAGFGKPELCDDVEASLSELRDGPAASQTAPAILEDPRQLTPQTPPEVLRSCALRGPTNAVRSTAMRLLRERLDPDSFSELLAEALTVDPPDPYNDDHWDHAIWYGMLALMFGDERGLADWVAGADPEQANWIDHLVLSGYQLDLTEKSAAELAKDYRAHLGNTYSDRMIRQAISSRLDKLPADEVIAVMPDLLDAERNVYDSRMLTIQLGGLWLRSGRVWNPTIVGLLEKCLEPGEHLAVRVTAQEMLQMIYEESR